METVILFLLYLAIGKFLDEFTKLPEEKTSYFVVVCWPILIMVTIVVILKQIVGGDLK